MTRVSHVASFTLALAMAKLRSMSIHGARPSLPLSRVSHVASFTLTPAMAKLQSMSIHGTNPLNGEATKHVNTWRPSFLAHESSFSCGIFHPNPPNGEATQHVNTWRQPSQWRSYKACQYMAPVLPCP